ncbi:MAG: Rrf2 family transcriptional regulator [Rhodospirillales bacterium]|nr:Rrf2 family transcriptional regulator [Rhodospirillales bacterium]
MLLSRYSDNSVRLLMHLTLQADQNVTVGQAAKHGGMSRNHLMKISQQLAQLGYIKTARGKGGGMRLAKDPASIRLGDLICQTESTLAIIRCDRIGCPVSGNCIFKKCLTEARDRFVETLNGYTLADVTANSGQLGNLLKLVPQSAESP